MKPITRNIILIGSLLLLLISSCNNGKKLLKIDSEHGHYCLPNTEFIIAGIKFRDSINTVKQLLKEPNEITKYIYLNLETWIYDDIEIEFYNDLVWSVKTESVNNSTPSGIRPGLSKSRVFQMLGYAPDSTKMIISNSKNEYQIVNCEYGNYMVFSFDSNDILKKLEFDNDIP